MGSELFVNIFTNKTGNIVTLPVIKNLLQSKTILEQDGDHIRYKGIKNENNILLDEKNLYVI